MRQALAGRWVHTALAGLRNAQGMASAARDERIVAFRRLSVAALTSSSDGTTGSQLAC